MSLERWFMKENYSQFKIYFNFSFGLQGILVQPLYHIKVCIGTNCFENSDRNSHLVP